MDLGTAKSELLEAIEALEETINDLSLENSKLRGLVLKVAAEALTLDEAMRELGNV